VVISTSLIKRGRRALHLHLKGSLSMLEAAIYRALK